MLTPWFGAEYLDKACWTLSSELFFYVCMFVLFVTKKMKYIEPLGLLWLTLMMINVRISRALNFDAPDFIGYSSFLTYGHLFFAGILFYKIKFEAPTIQRHICLGLCLMTQALVGRELFPSPQIVTLFFALFYLFCFDKLKFMRTGWLVFFGTISY